MQVIEKLIKSDVAPKDRGVIWFNTLDNHFYIFDSKDGWIDYIEKVKPVVDDALSADSLNALQNKVITEIIGGTSLDALETASKNFIDAINELLGALNGKVSQQEMTEAIGQAVQGVEHEMTEAINEAIDESLDEIKEEMQNLPDGQAVSAQVALNTQAIEGLNDDVSQLGQQVIYDVTLNNPTAGPNNDGKFESLSALLSDVNLSTLIPSAVRYGGMSIRFVQSSDNNYVQYLYLGMSVTGDPNPFINTANWERIYNEPTNNLCKIGRKSRVISYEDGSEVHMYDSNYNCTAFIDVSNISLIRYSLKCAETNKALIAAYDSSKTYIQANSVAPDVAFGKKEGIWEKSSTTNFVRLSFQIDAEDSHIAYVESPFFKTDVKDIAEEEVKENQTTNVEFDVTSLVQGLLKADTGSPHYTTGDYPNYRYCATYFPVYKVKKILTNARCTGSDAAICFYRKNKTFLSSIAQSSTNLTEHDVPEGAYYARFSTERYDITNGILAFAINSDTYEEYLISELKSIIEQAYDIAPLTSNSLLSATDGKLQTFSGAEDKYKACATFFPITEGKVLVTNAICKGSTAAICYYSAANTSSFLSSVQITDSQMNLLGHIVPSGAKYFRICTEKYDVTNSLLAISFGNNSNNEYIQFLLDKLSSRISSLESFVNSLNSSIKYFEPNMGEWIANETIKSFSPQEDVVEHKHSGTITPKSRFLVWGFDDFRNTDFSFIIPLFNKYGAKGEFNKIFNNIVATDSEKTQLAAVLRGKHEIGDHTWLHYKYPFDEPLWNGQNPNSPDGNQIPYPLDTDFTQAVDGYKNVFGIDTRWTVSGTNSSIPIDTTWANLSAAECQQIRELFSVMKDTSSNVIAKLDGLSNKYLGTSGSSNGSWSDAEGCYTGGIFTGCKTSANHEIWERYLLVTNLWLKDQFKLNYNLKTWSKPGSKASGCYYKYDGKKYYDRNHTILVNNLARFESSLYDNNDGTGKLRSWTDVLAEFGYVATNDAQDPSLVDGQTKPCMSTQFVYNSWGNKPNALIYPNTRNKYMDYASIATEYTEGTDLQGTEPYEVQMYSDPNSSFHKAVEGWRKSTANGIIASQITDSMDTWSERMIIEGLLKFCKSAGIQPITLAEAYDICFNNNISGGNLLYNPEFKNSAKEFMPTANVPDNPDGFDGDCEVNKVSGVPTLTINDTTIYDHYGVPNGQLVFKGSFKGSGTITIKEIKNNTPYANINSADTLATITINSESFAEQSETITVADNDLTAYEQLCAGYGNRVIGLRFIFSGGIDVRNISLKQD